MLVKELRDVLAARLGDPTFRLWTRDRVDKAIRDARDQFVRDTSILQSMFAVLDGPSVSNYNFVFERTYHKTYVYWYPRTSTANQWKRNPPRRIDAASLFDRTTYEQSWERDYTNGGFGPSSCTQPWERDLAVSTSSVIVTASREDYVSTTYPILPYDQPVGWFQLPDEATHIRRVMWDGRRVWPEHTAALSDKDRLFEEGVGEVDQYVFSNEGLRYFRRYRAPAGRGEYDMVFGDPFGVIRGFVNVTVTPGNALTHYNRDWGGYTGLPTPGNVWSTTTNRPVGWLSRLRYWSGVTFVGTWGVVRSLPKVRLYGDRWGMLRNLTYTGRNTMVEYSYVGQLAGEVEDVIDVPPVCVRIVRDHAMSQLLRLPGPGFSPRAAGVYLQRYQIGVVLVRQWISKTRIAQRRQYGKQPMGRATHPRVKWPYHFSGARWRG